MCLLGRKGETGLGSLSSLNTVTFTFFYTWPSWRDRILAFSLCSQDWGILELRPAENECATCYQGLTTEIKSP